MRVKSRDRFREIIKVFTFYGVEILVDSKMHKDSRAAENLRKACEELGPTFIKIGQVLSTRTDLLPKCYVEELIKLQDSAMKESFHNVKYVFEESLGTSLEENFLYFSKEPIASASIAQVHKGILLDGRSVVVKVQRPDIYEKMKMDLAILRRIIKLTRIQHEVQVVDLLMVLKEIEDATENELDFILEGKSINRFRENNKGVAPIYVPQVIEELWSNKVLTLEDIDGFKINDREAIEREGYDNKDIARKLALSYCKQIFEDGFFHGDPHPGNLLIYKGKICFIDFGIVGDLKEELRVWLNRAMFYMATQDNKKLVEFILAIGIKNGKVDTGVLYEDIQSIFDNYMTTSLKNIKMTTLIEEVFNIAKKNSIQFPRELVLLVKALVILEGVVADIDPELNIYSLLVSYVKNKRNTILLRELENEEVLLSLYKLLRDTARIPGKTLELLNTTASGRGKINVEIKGMDNIFRNVHNMVNRLTGGILISTLILSSSLIVSRKVGPVYRGISLIGVIGYVVSALSAIILLINMVKYGAFKNNNKKKP